jgi:hypothetical protein
VLLLAHPDTRWRGWASRFVGSSDGWRLASRVCYLLSVVKKSRRARTLGQGIGGADGADESLMAKGILQGAARLNGGTDDSDHSLQWLRVEARLGRS